MGRVGMGEIITEGKAKTLAIIGDSEHYSLMLE
jgi:hypothetical protein